MEVKTFWRVVALAGGLAVAGAGFAQQEQQETKPSQGQQQPRSPGTGPGTMQGYGPGMGPGMMGGYGPYGPGAMGGYGAYGPGMMGGYGGPYGPGAMGSGPYGPGAMGSGPYGPGAMGGYGPYGPGMMGGYGPYGPGRMGGYGPGYGYGPGPLHGLNLSQKQQQAIRDIMEQHRKQQWELMGQMNDKYAQMRKLYAQEPLDKKAIGDAYDQIAALRRQMIENRVDEHNQIAQQLTDQQRKQLQQWGGWQAE